MIIDASKPLLVFGGPYSNLQATEAMFAEIAERQIPMTNVICTGDVVAYAGDPEPTSQIIRQAGMHVIAGNCEEQLADAAADCGCGFEEGSACDVLSKSWFAFADREISADTRTWMADLPQRLRFTYADQTFCVVHGTRDQNNQFVFASQTSALAGAYRECEADFVLAGHCGLPFVSRIGSGAWINAGVIGVPANDSTVDGWFAIIERTDEGLVVSLKRLNYDYVKAAQSIRDKGHARPYADSIESGHWPSLDILPEVERSAAGNRLPEISERFAVASVDRIAESSTTEPVLARIRAAE